MKKSEITSADFLCDLDLPGGSIDDGPKKYNPRFLNVINVDNYFRPLIKNPAFAEKRLAEKLKLRQLFVWTGEFNESPKS